MRALSMLIALSLCAPLAFGRDIEKIDAEAAINHVGEQAIVCGTVASAKYAINSRGQPTFLDFDRRYPDQPFLALIWGEARAKFGEPENVYMGHKICVTGTIVTYKGTPEIVLADPSQLVAY